MRKKNVVLYTVIVFALTMVIAPLVVAKPDTRLNGDVYIVLQWDFVGFNPDPVGNPGDPNFQNPYSFIGTVSGDDITGVLSIALLEAWFPAPGVEHFIESWLIETSTGWIEGENKGKWTMSNFKWLANGEVTDASSEYYHLIGSKWQYGGTTDDPSVGPLNLVTGSGKFHITHNK